MKQTTSTEEVLSTSSQPEFIQKTNILSIAGGVALIVLSLLCMFLASRFMASNGTGQMVVMVLCACLLIAGIIIVFCKRHYLIYAESGCKIQQKNINLSEQDARKAAEILHRDGDLKTLPLSPAATDQYRFDIIGTTDRKYAKVQLLHYVPFNYEPMTPVFLLTDEEAAAAWEAVNRK